MTVKQVIQGKGGFVATIRPEATLTELVETLAEHRIGARWCPSTAPTSKASSRSATSCAPCADRGIRSTLTGSWSRRS